MAVEEDKISHATKSLKFYAMDKSQFINALHRINCAVRINNLFLK